uniref:Dedicator of cytokinesis 3 n=1 Tax=Oncorhynchus mykiss TaxID=8022 RepID=A0A8K9V583_ONCMY
MWTPLSVICTFRGIVTQGLSLEIGETIQILEKCEGIPWFFFSQGIFPTSYIHLKKAIVTNRGQYETVVPVEDPIVTEVTSTLQEWALLWKQLYVKHKVDLFYKLRHVMNELFDLRRQMLSGHLTQDQVKDVKRHITIRLDWGNEHLGLDLVPRKEFEMVDADQISVSDLYKMVGNTDHCRDLYKMIEPCRIPVPHHLFVSLKSFTYNTMGEDTDVFFSLYDLREGKQISEKFMVRLNKNEGPKNTDKVDRLCALFTVSCPYKQTNAHTHTHTHTHTRSRMLLNDSKKGPPHVQYRRPYGCAVLAMSDVLQTISELKEEKDFVLKVYTCNNENEWYQIHENIIRKSSTKYTAPSTNYGLIISLQLLRGEMEQIRRENPMIFNRGVAITRKLGFPDVIMPGDIRNDLYLTLERGDFERGGKSVQKNIEVSVYVLYADGEILKDCISLGSGEPHISEHRSFVLYHNNSPRWSEVVKLPIPIDRFRGSHLRFEFRHCSTKDKAEKKLFGFAFTPLMREDGTTLSDESHELYVYKCDENATFSNHALYLGLPCCKEDFIGCPNVPSSLIFQRSTKETLWISTQLSSTKLTQNVDLLALLKWKAHPDRVMDILGRLRHVSGEEIVKFLQDILDTLFSILDDNTDKYGPLVFQSLVFIINLLRDSKYYHFRPVMDTYIQKHFAGALAYKELIRCLKWYMDRSAEVVKQDHIQEAMRALEYLLKFIIQSRILYSRATCGMEEEQFRASIQELFQSIRFVLSLDSRSSETLIFTQAALLNSFPAIFDELLQMFTVQEVAEFVRGTLGSMPSTVHIGQSMDVVKLQSIARTVDSRLFSFPESRRILLPVVLHHIHLHLRQQKELLICSGILSSIFSIIKTSSLQVGLHKMMVESLLDVLLQTLLAIMSKSQSQEAVRGQRCPQCTAEITGEYVSCLLSLLRQMSEIHFQHLLDNFQSKEELKEFLLKIFCVFRNLMKLSVFPRDWNVMRLLTSNIIVTTAQCLSPALNKNFTEADFDFKVWNSYFSLAVLYINQPSLQLENTTPAKRKNVLDKYGDMRVMMAYELFSMWQNLGENKIHFIPGMIGPFLGVTLVPQGEVRNIMIPIFHDMMDWEQRKNGNFKQVEAELIDKLDSLVSEGKGDENYRELFSLLLLEKIEQETWRETGISFVTSVTRLMERLLDYRDCMKGDETENKKIGCTVNLLNFYKSEINKEEMYIRYIHKLCGMHLQAENYTEAAFTLLLYWELLHWEERPLREFLHYPAQSEWHRKEGLCRKVINYFNKGKCWEYGIPLCRELAYQYETLYDYQSLSWIRKMEAAYYDNIMEQQRLEPEFFRVGFYGRKFPFFLRVTLVCMCVCVCVLLYVHNVYVNMSLCLPQKTFLPPKLCSLTRHPSDLQIYAVSAVPENVNVLQMDRVPDRIKSFYRVNNVRRFRYDRPFHKGSKDRENEFKSLWIERTTLILTHPLPGISRWFEVEKRELVSNHRFPKSSSTL